MNEPTRVRRQPNIEYARFGVRVVEGPDQGIHRELDDHPLGVGSDDRCELVLTDDTVSRRHCELVLAEPGIRVRDMNSTNGIYIGKNRVFDAILTGETTLQLGQTLLRLEPLKTKLTRNLSESNRFGDLVGASIRMRALFAELNALASNDVSVLIEGETGTGKDVVAESLHRASGRAAGPFVVFDCGAASPNLIESELFGHERGAFTGAVTSQPGVFEQAHGGTIFIDELGELPKELQPKLLRVLEKRQVRRLGSSRVQNVDVRLVSATNRHLSEEVRLGRFRQDLFYRVATTQVRLPPLRDRVDDIPLLLDHFLRLQGSSIRTVPEHILDLFRAHRWPGNVRELQNAAMRLLVTPDRAIPMDGASQDPETIKPVSPEAVQPLRIARRSASEAFERGYLEALLTTTDGNISRAAAVAEVSRQMIQKLMRKYR